MIRNGALKHSGFRPQDEAGYEAMGSGWPRVVAGPERTVAARNQLPRVPGWHQPDSMSLVGPRGAVVIEVGAE
jgi:hypothetical protein